MDWKCTSWSARCHRTGIRRPYIAVVGRCEATGVGYQFSLAKADSGASHEELVLDLTVIAPDDPVGTDLTEYVVTHDEDLCAYKTVSIMHDGELIATIDVK